MTFYQKKIFIFNWSATNVSQLSALDFSTLRLDFYISKSCHLCPNYGQYPFGFRHPSIASKEESCDPNTKKLRCFNCCDGGYFPRRYRCDGITDCDNGSDEKYCKDKQFQTKKVSCLENKQVCREDSQCCSNMCNDGICWDEECR